MVGVLLVQFLVKIRCFLLLLILMVLLLMKVLDRICCVSGFFSCDWIVCFSGCVLYIGLNLMLLSRLNIVLEIVSFNLCLVRCFFSLCIWMCVICLICCLFSGWNIMMLFRWLMNFGWKCVCIMFIIVVFICVQVFGLLLVFMFWIWCEFRFEVIMMMVLWKFMVWFWLLVRWLLFSICSRMLNIFGCVFFILFSRISEYG